MTARTPETTPKPPPDRCCSGSYNKHVGAELSAHETISVEQEAWANIGQLAAEYETLAAAAQHDRWAHLVRASGLTDEEAKDTITSPAFSALAAELRRAEANHHDIETLLPCLVRARGFTDADDITAVLPLPRHPRHDETSWFRARSEGTTPDRQAHPRGNRHHERRVPPSAHRTTRPDRGSLSRASRHRAHREPKGLTTLGIPPKETRAAAAWLQAARTVAAYRDRYDIIDTTPLGAPAENDAQNIDAARARAVLDRARTLAVAEQHVQELRHQTRSGRGGPTL
ncbi:hypothetical protein [Pseudoclavibacter sp. CFCC 13611]|uniref:hypothetical protein n=1 Tax=Pseudoclavibacter sp. CFCC 13611 TaxID=2615178 RepID=UPI0013012E3D|nr:hypothetical protein [Pseudoclavibacter sp. CFCC 13611]KAB1663364.1 hypothetical protein F8O08_06320 [Pseudoclavibacter sp. CFCC 13611]